MDLREITLPRVGNQDDHHLSRLRLTRHLERREEGGAARAARENPLLAREPPREVERLRVVHRDDLVDHREVEGAGKEILTDSFHLVRLGRHHLLRIEVVSQDRADRVRPDHLDLRILLFQVPRRPADRPAGPQAGHEVVQLASGLLPDLGAGGSEMSLGVRGVVVLIREVGARHLAPDPLGDLVVGFGRVGRERRRGDHDLGAEGFQ